MSSDTIFLIPYLSNIVYLLPYSLSQTAKQQAKTKTTPT